ncbi:uncharacterized protein LOC122381705 [Amphibalanus amphitrite]|uniref:uncharacterized protein LOC122381705 n=1 Tax=Amphibalanus amphitrite TaxID=1232801 RepID=UPI001C9191E8|nr:uncharacterized protein LOC122381705 [Amphibalanus amphitrite]
MAAREPVQEPEPEPVLELRWSAEPVDNTTAACGWPWAAHDGWCYLASEETARWQEAAAACAALDGSLVTVSDESTETILTALLTNSGGSAEDELWTGGSNQHHEGTLRWPDGRPVTEKCSARWCRGGRLVESEGRRTGAGRCLALQLLPDGEMAGRVRPCSDRLTYVCRRPGAPASEDAGCNRTILLSAEIGPVTVNSAGRPDRYGPDLTCVTNVSGPTGSRVELIFTRFILEQDDSCDYDSLTVLEEGQVVKRVCGDWSARLKLLRYVSSTENISLVFVTDYMNAFPGFEAVLQLVTEERHCTSDGTCFTVVRSPTVPYSGVRDTCGRQKGVPANVGELEQLSEVLGSGSYWVQPPSFVTESITRATSSTNGTTITTNPDVHISTRGPAEDDGSFYGSEDISFMPNIDTDSGGAECVAVEVRGSPPVVRQTTDCQRSATAVCRLLPGDPWRWPAELPSPGRLRSPGYPAGYPPLLDLRTELRAPAGSRLAVRVERLQLDVQPDCLHDSLQISWPPDGRATLCGRHHERRLIFPPSNTATVTFTSDWSVSGPGASLSWSSVDVSRCTGEIVSSIEGTVSSPGYPHLLPTDQECITFLLAPGDTHLVLLVTSLDLSCEHGRLEVGSVPRPGDAPIALRRLCGRRRAQILLLAPGPYVRLQLNTGSSLEMGTGYSLSYRAVSAVDELVPVSVPASPRARVLEPPLLLGTLPYRVAHRLAAPVGHNVQLKLTFIGSLQDTPCADSTTYVHIRDAYAPGGGGGGGVDWWLCPGPGARHTASIRSYLHVLTVTRAGGVAARRRRRQRRRPAPSAAVSEPPELTVSYSAVPDGAFNNKSSAAGGAVEDCALHPCVNSGKCTKRGASFACVCPAQFVGLFCHIPACELSPCLFGTCEATDAGVRCHCDPLHDGLHCEQRRSPCDDNPCRGRGLCTEANDTFVCHCHGWWSGRHCETRVLHIPYKPLSERMIEEPFWLGLITVTVVMVGIGIIWCIKKHFAERIEQFFAEEIEKSKYYGGYMPSPCTSHALLRESPAVSPQPPRSLLQRLSLRKTSRVSLLSLSSVASSPGHDLRRSVEDFFRAPLGHRRSRSPLSPRYKRNSSGESHELDAESRGILRGLVTPRDPLAERSRSYEEFIQLAEMKLEDQRKSGSQSVDDPATLAETSFHDIMDSKFDKRVKFASLMSHVSRDMMTSSGSDLSCAGDASSSYKPQNLLGSRSRRSLSFKRRGRAPAFLPTDDTVETTSTGSDLTPDAVRRSALIQSLSTPSSPRHRPIAKITSADSILSMLRGWANGKSVSTPSSPANSDHGDENPPVVGVSPPSANGSGQTEKGAISAANSLEIPVFTGGSGKTGGGSSSQSVTLEIPCHDYRCLSPITEVPTPSPSPLPTPIRMARRPIHIHMDQRVSDMDSDASTSFSMSGNEQSRTSSASLDAPEGVNRTPSPTLNRKYSCNFPIPMVIIETTHTSPEESDEAPPPSPPPITVSAPTPSTPAVPSWPSPPAIVISEDSGDPEGSPPSPHVSPDPVPMAVPSFTFLAASPTDEVPPLMPLPQPGERKLSAPHALSMLRRAPCLKEGGRADSLELQPRPGCRLTRNMSEQDSDTDSTKQTVGMLLAPLAPNGAHSTSESNLSSSGYSSAYSPAPSRCSSINPLLEEACGPGGAAQRRPVLLHQATLEDDSALGSNDDCLSTDPEMPRPAEPPPPPPPQIVIHPPAPLPSDSSLEEPQRPSPASSRSESPLSDRTGRRFSRQFFGKLELPATDSDCLYDYPSSERLTAAVAGGSQRRAGRRRRRGAVKWRSVPTVPPDRTGSPSADRQKAWAAQTHRRRGKQQRSEAGWTSSNESVDVTRSAPVGDCQELYQESSDSEVSSARSVSSSRRHRRRIRRQGSLDTSDDQGTSECAAGGLAGRRASRFRVLATQLRSLRRLRKPRPLVVGGSTSSEEPGQEEPDERTALLSASGRTLTHSCSDPCEYGH